MILTVMQVICFKILIFLVILVFWLMPLLIISICFFHFMKLKWWSWWYFWKCIQYSRWWNWILWKEHKWNQLQVHEQHGFDGKCLEKNRKDIKKTIHFCKIPRNESLGLCGQTCNGDTKFVKPKTFTKTKKFQVQRLHNKRKKFKNKNKRNEYK